MIFKKYLIFNLNFKIFLLLFLNLYDINSYKWLLTNKIYYLPITYEKTEKNSLN